VAGSVAETAAHVGMIALVYTAMIRGDGGPLPLPDLAEPMNVAGVGSISRMNALALYPERDPVRLAERLRGHRRGAAPRTCGCGSTRRCWCR
jgi:hypothetical protein